MEYVNFMQRALQLALKAQYQTEPNPMVGAVLVNAQQQIISEGYHAKAGLPHAEVNVLKDLSDIPADATLFVTLEPCCFFGKTPPCTDLIIKKGIKKVVIGCLDPNPKVSGQGVAKLQAAGVEVIQGVCEKECRDINTVFNKHILQKIPYVAAKIAMSLDGKIAMPSGESKWITETPARVKGQTLRSRYQGITVGKNTLLQDNPLLTDRASQNPRHPQRIVFSSKGEIPADSHFMNNKETPRLVFTGNQISQKQIQFLEQHGVLVFVSETKQPDLQWALQQLYQYGICSLLIEGGAEIITSFLQKQLIDQLYVFISGKIIGSHQAPDWCNNLNISQLNFVPQLQFQTFEKLGSDLFLSGEVIY